MSHVYRSFSSHSPQYRLTPTLPPCIFEPAVYSADDANALNGHGFGFGADVAIKAMGEYFERYAAFRAITPQGRGKISDMRLTGDEERTLTQALQQTCYDEVRDELQSAEFQLVEVHRLSGAGKVNFPAVLFSLHSFDNYIDARFVPVRDSSGSAIHREKNVAFRSALLEFVERQCTTAMWVSRRCNAVEVPLAKLQDVKARTIYHQMATLGRLRLLDISFLGGASVKFCEYHSENSDEVVNFSCGCAANFEEKTATMKSFTEAWQTSILLPQMAFFGANEYGSTSLKDNFKAANYPEFDLGVGVKPINIGKENSETGVNYLVDSILSVSENVYVYFRELNIPGTKLHFCRIVSPDFFIHMSPDKHNNNNNCWIDRFCEKSDRRLVPMPFS